MSAENVGSGWLAGRMIWAALAVGAVLGGGCGGGTKAPVAGGGGSSGAAGGAGGAGVSTLSAWSDLTQPVITLEGGGAPSAGGQGRGAGSAHLVSKGGITIDPASPPLASPPGVSPPP